MGSNKEKERWERAREGELGPVSAASLVLGFDSNVVRCQWMTVQTEDGWMQLCRIMVGLRICTYTCCMGEAERMRHA